MKSQKTNPGSSQNRMSRRSFTGSLFSAAIAPVIAGTPLVHGLAARSKENNAGHELWVSAQGGDADHYAMSWISAADAQATSAQTTSAQPTSVLSGFRGHGAAHHPQQANIMLMFSRSPGTEGIVVDISSGNIIQRFSSPAGHHMHGHGCFSADGSVLFTTESDYRSGEGKLILRDTRNYKIIAEFLTHGIGPHDVHLMPDAKTLVVANGGLRTHPDSGRTILNLDSMQSSLVNIDSASGRLLSQHTLNESKASIRHLDVADDGTVAIATQVQRPAMSDNHLVFLAALHKPGEPSLQLLQAPDALISHFNDYMGSVVINNKERIAGFTSPRGDIAGFWHIDSGELVGYHSFHDVCGLTKTRDEQYFVLSNSAGEIRQLSAISLRENKSLRKNYDNMRWDNHMFSITTQATGLFIS